MHTFSKSDNYNLLLKPGTVIWRQCAFKRGKMGSLVASVNDPVFELTDKNTWMGRCFIQGGGDFISEPVAHGAGFPGIIMFMEEKPESHWTHLLVRKVQKEGKVIFAEPTDPYPMEDYLNFRSNLATAFLNDLNGSFDDKVKLAMAIWPGEIRPGERRLISEQIHGTKDKDVLFRFCHLRRMLKVSA